MDDKVLLVKYVKYSAIVVICLLALVVRVAHILPPYYIAFDAKKRYVPQAKNLLAGNGFSKSTKPPYEPDASEHNPGYAFFLAGAYFVSNFNLTFVVLVQLLLELSTIYLTWLIAGLLGLHERAKRVAVIAALLCPLLARWTRAHATEILATFFITLALYLLILSVKRDRPLCWVAAGLACMCAWFVRMDQILVLLLLVPSCAILSRKIAKPLILVLTFLTAASPWMIRNYQITGRFEPVGDLAFKRQMPKVRWANSWITTMEDHYRHIQNIGHDPKVDYKKLTRKEVKKGKFRLYVVLPVLRLYNVLKDDLTSDIPKRPNWIPARVVSFATMILGILGIAISIYRRQWIMLLPFCLIVGRWIIPMSSAAAMDFRIMVESLPAVYLFAGIAANSIYETAMRSVFKRPANSFSTQEKPISSETSDV